jgi:thioredoxin reductase (NADPH)
MAQQEILPDDVKQAIKETFQQGLTTDVAIEVYTKSGKNDQFNEAAVSLVKALAELSDKLKVAYHAVGDELSVKRGVTRSPSILIAPDTYHIRYTGAPVGEEPLIPRGPHDGIHGKASAYRTFCKKNNGWTSGEA